MHCPGQILSPASGLPAAGFTLEFRTRYLCGLWLSMRFWFSRLLKKCFRMFFVIPVQTGIHCFQTLLDTRLSTYFWLRGMTALAKRMRVFQQPVIYMSQRRHKKGEQINLLSFVLQEKIRLFVMATLATYAC
jgi:hypothetical protein